MSYSLAQILVQVRERRLQLAADTLASLLLAAAEQCLDGRGAEERSIWLENSGSITVHAVPGGAEVAVASLKAALGVAFELSPDRHRFVEALAASDCGALVSALRAALVPLNRPAARRTLTRLFRQLERSGLEAAPEIRAFVFVPETRESREVVPTVTTQPVQVPVALAAVEPPEPTVQPRALVSPMGAASHDSSVHLATPVVAAPVQPVVLPDEPLAESLTQILGSLAVAPHERSRMPRAELAHPDQAELTRPLVFSTPVPRAAPQDEYTVEVPEVQAAPLLDLRVSPVLVEQPSWVEAPLQVEQTPMRDESTPFLEVRVTDALASPSGIPSGVRAPDPDGQLVQTPLPEFIEVPVSSADEGLTFAAFEASAPLETPTPYIDAPLLVLPEAKLIAQCEASSIAEEENATPSAPRETSALGGDEPTHNATPSAPRETSALGGDEPTYAAFAPTHATVEELEPPLFDEQTSLETAVAVDREPGLGRIESKRSELDELVKNFRVSPGVDREVVLAALERSIASHGTPLPPIVRQTSR